MLTILANVDTTLPLCNELFYKDSFNVVYKQFLNSSKGNNSNHTFSSTVEQYNKHSVITYKLGPNDIYRTNQTGHSKPRRTISIVKQEFNFFFDMDVKNVKLEHRFQVRPQVITSGCGF